MIKNRKSQIRAFTIIEMLLVLFIVSLMLTVTSLQIRTILEQVEEMLFFKRFESMYMDCQQFSLSQQETTRLVIHHKELIGNDVTVTFPKSISSESEQVIEFNPQGGNSTLKSIVFHASSYDIKYQLYLGNGKFKKTKN